MIIKSIFLKEGIYERNIEFSVRSNLIYSSENSRGKTTLLRFILYALGYSVPNTRQIKFGKCDTKLLLLHDDGGTIQLSRSEDSFLELRKGNEKMTFVLPTQHLELLSVLFGMEDPQLLSNLLGAFYLDQEKGWTLLNRGIVIGSIHFNIEELIRGLSGIDCSKLIEEEAQIQRNLAKYKNMFSIAQYRDSVEESVGSLISEDYDDINAARINTLQLERSELRAELRRIDHTLSDNKRFRKFVADLQLLIQAPDGTRFPVKENNIVALNDSVDLLVAKRKSVSVRYSGIEGQIQNLQKEQETENEQLAFFTSVNQADAFDSQLVKIPMDQFAIKAELIRLEKKLKTVRGIISRKTRNNRSVIDAMSRDYIHYATKLGLGNSDTISLDYLFTSNLKELSGAVLHKTAFAFRLAYINAIERKINIKLPIIMDSPSGKEVDKANIKLMMDILEKDYSENQIIIASIFHYDLEGIETIEIKNRLIDQIILRNESE